MKTKLSGLSKAGLAALSVAMVTASQPAFAWGAFGHQTVAWIAETDLKAKLAANHPADATAKWMILQDLISSDPWLTDQIANHGFQVVVAGQWHLADIATWADWIRSQDTNNNQYRDGDNVTDHSVRLPLSAGTPNNPACTGKATAEPDPYPTTPKKCADDAVTAFRVAIANSAYSSSVQQRSLKYVVHLVGDLHQPLHGSDPIGYSFVSLTTPYGTSLGSATLDPAFPHDVDGNPNLWYNLHYVWDNSIVHDTMKKYGFTKAADFATWITTPAKPASMLVSGTPRNWAEEGSNWATTQIYTDAGYTAPPICWSSGAAPAGGAVCSTTTQIPLDSAYTVRKANLVVFRLRQAGLRLSCVLYHSLYPAETDPCNP